MPDHGKLQLAGNVGFVSPGVGWALARRVDGDVFFGWVPESVGGTDIFALTGKLSFAPWTVDLPETWRLRPAVAALQLTYTFGDQYEVVPDELFPPSALRSALALGMEIGRRVGNVAVGLYAEVVALDVDLAYLLSDWGYVPPEDVLSVAVGARVAF